MLAGKLWCETDTFPNEVLNCSGGIIATTLIIYLSADERSSKNTTCDFTISSRSTCLIFSISLSW